MVSCLEEVEPVHNERSQKASDDDKKDQTPDNNKNPPKRNDDVIPKPDETTTEKEADIGEGLSLFKSQCKDCHKNGVEGKTAEDIEEAILEFPQMSAISLTKMELAHLEAYLQSLKEEDDKIEDKKEEEKNDDDILDEKEKEEMKEDLIKDGSLLWKNECSICHVSGVKGKTTQDIEKALKEIKQMSNINLEKEEIEKISAYLESQD